MGARGCGIARKCIHRGNWIITSKVAVLLEEYCVSSVEVAGVSILTDILNLVFTQQLCVENIDKTIDYIVRRQRLWLCGGNVTCDCVHVVHACLFSWPLSRVRRREGCCAARVFSLWLPGGLRHTLPALINDEVEEALMGGTDEKRNW